MRLADIAGTRLHCAISGPEDGRPVVFANLLGAGFRVWEKLLPPGLRMLRSDMRRQGLSDAPEGDHDIDALVEEAAGLFERSGSGGAIILGLSIGGLVARGLAAARPDPV
jgi:3-oxoadipate enol-lactonase